MSSEILNQSLKDKNLRVTQARLQVFDILSGSRHALSPKEVFEKITHTSKSSTDLVSVYRNLSLFSEIGIAHRFQDGKYSICKHDHLSDHQDHDHEQHQEVHLLINCLKCGRSREIDTHSIEICQLATQLRKFSKPLKELNSIVLQGICQTCR
jgi:Fe2+ or Zn2+ uptake regulation protein